MQLAALKKAGCQPVFKDEGLSGATTKRPALVRCLKKLEHGDTLIVWRHSAGVKAAQRCGVKFGRKPAPHSRIDRPCQEAD